MVKFSWCICLVALAALTVSYSQAAPPATQPTVQTLPASRGGQDLVGQPFPKLELSRWINTPDAKPLDTANSVTLYRYWTDSCPFCLATLPAVETLRLKYADQGLKVVAVYHPKPPRPVTDEVIAAAATERGYRGAVAVDADWSALKKVWLNDGRQASTSVSFLVDHQGIIRFVHPGVQYFPSSKPQEVEANHDYELLDAAIATVLAEKPTTEDKKQLANAPVKSGEALLTVDESQSMPALAVLSKFTAADVPDVGPEEIPIDPPAWKVSEPGPNLPGKGLAQHPMLYIGEGCNKMFLVMDGKVIWTYSTGKGWEYDDIWLLSNGNILFSRMGWAAEVNPQKKIVWRLDAPAGSEIHSVQPIGLDKVLVMQNGTPAKLMVINKKTGVIEVEHAFPKEDTGAGVHGQFRRGRITAQGTYVVSFLSMHKVVEYDKDFKPIWSYTTHKPWAAIRLKNGNTLISDEQDEAAREVNPKGEVVWEFNLKKDLPPDIGFSGSQTCVRLANGNTIFCSRGNAGKSPQLVEVTPDKKVVWVLHDWKSLGPATAIQVLDDSGVPENPGDCQR